VLAWLVESIPGIIVLILLLSTIAALIYLFVYQENPEEQDFKRILGDIDAILEQGELTSPRPVPIQSESPLVIVMYPDKYPNAPQQCEQEPCICLHTSGDERAVKCKQYPQLQPCPTADCSANKFCINNYFSFIPKHEQKTIYIKKECNELNII